MRGGGHIWLVGMPASGKSTVGRLLAREMGRPFTDSDRALVKAAGHGIPWIFEHLGEKAFRRIEARVLRGLALQATPRVIATGGGAVTVASNLKLMKGSGRVVFIDTSLDEIEKRLSGPEQDRPLMRGCGLRGKVQALYDARKDAYRRADFRVRGSRPPAKVAAAILDRLKGSLT
jgi:shikimate kinase